MATTKVIVLDLGGVLMAHDTEAKKRFKREETPALRMLHEQFGRGEISADEFMLRSGYSREEWYSLHAGISAETIEWLKDISAHYPVYLLSNNDAIRWAHVVADYPDFIGDFRGLILSQEVGSLKPDDTIYEVTEQRIKSELGYDPEIYFVDDSEENRATAVAHGWSVYARYRDLPLDLL